MKKAISDNTRYEDMELLAVNIVGMELFSISYLTGWGICASRSNSVPFIFTPASDS